MKLTNSRCQCIGCGEYFNSTHAFDKHRVGKQGNRSCLTPDQLLSKGMEKNEALFWTTGLRPSETIKTA